MGTVGSNIIFAIGATGASKAAGQFAIVGAAIVAVGAAIGKALAEAERFADTFTRMSDKQVAAAMAVDKATAGVVDTHAALKAQVKLTEAGLGENAKLMEAIGRLAGDMAQKLGEGPEGVTNRVNRLTDAISKGQTRALKEYGIDLENTEDLLLAQAEATDKVIDRAGALNDLQIRTTEEGWARLQNDIGTTIGLLWSGAEGTTPLVDAFNQVHDGMGAFNNLLMSPETGDAFRSYMFSIEGVNASLQTLKGWLTGNTDAVRSFAQQLAESLDRAKALKTGNIFGFTPETMGGEGSVFDPTATVVGAAPVKKKKAGGGGGRKREQKFDMEFSLEESEASELEYMMGGEISQARKDWQMRLMDWEINSAADRDRQLYEQTIEYREAQWEHELQIEQQAEEYERQRHEWRMQRLGIEESRRVSATEQAFGIEQQHLDASLQQWESGVKGKSEMMAGFFGNMANGMEVFGKRGFKAWKAFAIAEATASMLSSAVKSYEAMAGIPYVGPALGFVAAAAALAFGAAQISKLAQLKYGGGTPAHTGGGFSGGGRDWAPSGASVPSVGGGGGVTNIEVVLGEDSVLKATLNANDKASQNGQRSFKVSGI